MGVMLARIGRYWDCFEEVEEYQIEVSKVKRIRKMKKPQLSEVGSTNNPELQVNDEKDLDLSSMQKLRPGRVAIAEKTLYSKNIVLDGGDDGIQGIDVQQRQADSSLSNLNPQPTDQTQMQSFKAKLLKKKLQRIKEKRREREIAQSIETGIERRSRYGEKPHILNIHSNQEFFVDKEEIDEFGGGRDD